MFDISTLYFLSSEEIKTQIIEINTIFAIIFNLKFYKIAILV